MTELQIRINESVEGVEDITNNTDIEVYRPLPERLQIIDVCDEGEKEAVLRAADYRFEQGRQWHQIFKDRQWAEEGYERGEDWFKQQSKGLTAARGYATFYLFCLECDRQGVDRPTSITQVEAFGGHGFTSIEERVRMWNDLLESDDPLGGRAIRKKIEARRRVPDDEEDTKVIDQEEGVHLEVTLPTGEVVTAQTPEELQEKLDEKVQEAIEEAQTTQPAIPAPQFKLGRKNLTPEEAQKKLRELNKTRIRLEKEKKGALEAEKKLQKEIEKRIEDAAVSFKKEVAKLKNKYGDDEELEFMEIPDEEWISLLSEASDVRVKDAGKLIKDIYTGFPERMMDFMPGEAAQAALGMQQSEKIVDALRFMQQWIGGVAEEMEDIDSLASQRVKR